MSAATAEQVREELGRPLKDSTIRTVLRRLEEKGYLAHSLENRTFVYRPAESRQRVAGRAVKRIVDWFCEGSVEALLVGMVDSKVLDRAELQRLADRIAQAQKTATVPGTHRWPQSPGSLRSKGEAMISALVPLLLEASLRALVAAVAVWAGLRLLGVGNVLVQKAAWGLVLLAALAMPLLPRCQATPRLGRAEIASC